MKLADIRDALGGHVPETLDASDSPRRAAVAAILRPGSDGAEVLFMRRAEHPGDPWSGHMAFPGGRREPTDETLLATAVRETREEVGLDLHAVGECIGQLDDLEAIARARRVGMVIRPFVFALGEDRPLRPNHEVAELVWAPVAPMLTQQTATWTQYERDGHEMTLPAFDVGGRVVWGLTHRMLTGLFAVLQ